MGWRISISGTHSHDQETDPLAANAADFAIRDKTNSLFHDLLRLNGVTIDEAEVETDSTGEIVYVAPEAKSGK